MESAAMAVQGPASLGIQSLPVIMETLPFRIRVQLGELRGEKLVSKKIRSCYVKEEKEKKERS